MTALNRLTLACVLFGTAMLGLYRFRYGASWGWPGLIAIGMLIYCTMALARDHWKGKL